ncbi:Ferredoxin-2 [Pirellula sp. SH-Sr6A]|uniref:ATP-binding protein n=1 Tax=Pirellula sp. SH-Sr6A TaxID=1632865 RepID=UPI00078CD599|nr:ferredoxin family protein [Pirellula sp. SH-Sr6A]AMV33839.1 Ferredoxin-2 [Pirellula sp. SH-Sr6A]
MIQENHGLLVILSQGQSRSPEKRALEEGIADMAARLPNTVSLVVPHLYDLGNDSESLARIRQWKGPLVILTWLFDRAAHWILDRMDIRGTPGDVELINPDAKLDADDDEDETEDAVDEREEDRVVKIHPRPNRGIYSIDLRASDRLEAFETEFRRILNLERLDSTEDRETLTLERFLHPTNSTALSTDRLGMLDATSSTTPPSTLQENLLPIVHESPLGITPIRIDEHPARRWYPVIDYSRCTNCMECIDFCLFGVYGVDRAETILVEQPDNCRKGCPACSRVCPENAIIFPQHKSPAIAGAPVESGGAFKIDLSKLFGAPDRNEDPVAAAARERDEQLILAGRAAVGSATSPGSSKPATAASLVAENGGATKPSRDALDSLIDQLDSLDL